MLVTVSLKWCGRCVSSAKNHSLIRGRLPISFGFVSVPAGLAEGGLQMTRDGYEKLVRHVIAVQQKLGKQSKNHAVKSIVETQTGLTRRVTSAYTSAARKLIP
jgi:hypothetical protein